MGVGAQQSRVYRCASKSCLHQFDAWYGRCPSCDAIGTVVSFFDTNENRRTEFKAIADFVEEDHIERCSTGINAIDMLTGGGLVRGSSYLLSGGPGAGKSTLGLTIAHTAHVGSSLIVASEEPANSVLMRAKWLGLVEREKLLSRPKTMVYRTESTERMIWAIEEQNPQLVVVDSINMFASVNSEGRAGSVPQIRLALKRLQDISRERGLFMLIVAQVTKSGEVAGPKSLQHGVDVTIRVTIDARDSSVRRAIADKNRWYKSKFWVSWRITTAGFVDAPDASADSALDSMEASSEGLEDIESAGEADDVSDDYEEAEDDLNGETVS